VTGAVAPPVVLRVPAEGSFVSTVRIFAGAIGRRSDLDDERIDDLKLALSEIASGMITDGTEARSIAFEIVTDDRGLHVRTTGPLTETDPSADLGADHRRRLLEALVPNAVWSEEGDEQLVTFSLAR
jgi:anti-sigma regulatory factor (Ser/Thr protein kinase)